MSELMPTNIEAEEAILGGILIDPEAISRIAEILRPEYFAISAHQVIYKHALELHFEGKPTDLMTLTTRLADRNKLEEIGGQSKLAQLAERTVSAVNIDQYAILVEDKYIRRRLIHAGNEIVQLGYETATELPIVLDKAEQTIFSITQDRPQQDLVPISETINVISEELENRNEGLTLPGIPCGFYDLDAMTGGFQRSDLIIVAARPSMGKCIAFNTLIVQQDGSLSTIAEIYQQQQAKLLTLGKDWKFYLTQPSAFIDDGIKPIFRVTTRLGRFVETTITHPYLTIKGWRQLAELKVGDKIAVPRKIDVFGTDKIRTCEVKLLAYLIGDGCLVDTTPKFTNNHPLIQADFTQAAQEFADLKVRKDVRENKATTLYVSLSQGKKNPLTAWLEKLDLWQKDAHNKTVPSLIFRLDKSQVALFLNRLFATDGWATVLTSGQAQLGYGSVSETLARQIQHLLLRFGIIAALKKRYVKYKNTRRIAWQLNITDAESIKTFISDIGIFGKEDAVNKVQAALANKQYQTNRDLIPMEIWAEITAVKGNEPWTVLAKRAGIKGYTNIHVGKRSLSRERLFILATALEHLPLQQLATSDIYWDEIVSIEPMGCQQVYDLTIPETHNFVANDICVHNTAFCTNIAHNIAAAMKLPIAIFSLEMSKEQLVQRLLSSEAGIESNRLRSGRISQNEWTPISSAIGSLSELPIFIDDTPNITVTEMRSKARRLQAEQGGAMGLILLDYLQLMEGSSDNRVQELSRITRSLKGLARELNVPIIALSQLSRGVEARTNKRPMMSDLRESGSIEQDADLVIMLYREEYYNPDTPDRGIAEIIITKHRNGPTGVIKLIFDPQFTRFRNLAASRRS